MNPEQLSALLPRSIEAAPCYIHIRRKNITQHQELLAEAIEQFKPIQGWLNFQSNVCFFYSPEFFETAKDFPPKGFLLNGELINDHNKSLHIREDGAAGWIATYYHEVDQRGLQAIRSEKGQVFHSIVDNYSILAKTKQTASSQAKILYRRYWIHSKDIGYHIYAARFNGFRNGEYLS